MANVMKKRVIPGAPYQVQGVYLVFVLKPGFDWSGKKKEALASLYWIHNWESAKPWLQSAFTYGLTSMGRSDKN